MPLAVSGAWNAFRAMHAVCSCIKVPLAVSGGRHMAGVAYCKLLHQSAFSGVVCGDIMLCIVYSVFLASRCSLRCRVRGTHFVCHLALESRENENIASCMVRPAKYNHSVQAH